MPDLSASQPSRLRFTLRALASTNYRLFFGGQLVSLIGTWLTSVATSWLVYRLASHDDASRGALMLGVVGFASQIPIFLFAPFAGVWVDRWPRRKILIVTQALAMLQSFALAGLALSHVITIPQVIALAMFQGLINAIDLPARQSLLVELVDPGDLPNAIALNSSMVHGARLIGPALAGVIIYEIGEGFCFLIDGFSYLGVLIALSVMRVAPRASKADRPQAWQSLLAGVRYATGFAPVREILLVVAVASLVATSQSVLMPIFADRILGGGERTLGMLLGASGLGALAGSLYLASRTTVLGLGRLIAGGCIVMGAGLATLALSRHLYLSLPVLSVVGCAFVVQMASCNTVLQTLVDDDKRGRVMSLYTMAFMGTTPFGSLVAGTLASRIGVSWTLVIAGTICTATGLGFLWRLSELRRLIRPIYRRKGILPEVATALQSAAEATAVQAE